MLLYKDWLSQTTPTQLYHYTGKESLLGILQNKQFWASHILYQNDPTEFDLAINILKETINGIPNVLAKYSIDKDQLFDFVEAFRGVGIYTVSLTEERDLLSQWRGYASVPPGFCVGFRSAELKKRLEKMGSKDTSPPNAQVSRKAYDVQIVKCIYDTDDQKDFIKELVADSFSELKKNIGGYIQGTIAAEITSRLLKYAPIFKHHAFQEEKEWRIIVSDVTDRNKEKERAGRSHFIPYFQLDFQDQVCIGDIIIGPSPESELVRRSTLAVCFRNDVEFSKDQGRELMLSEIPYRNW